MTTNVTPPEERQVVYVVDDALNGRRLGADMYATIRKPGGDFKHGSVIVVCQSPDGPIGVATHSYLDVQLTPEEAAELATDFLKELNIEVLSVTSVMRVTPTTCSNTEETE